MKMIRDIKELKKGDILSQEILQIPLILANNNENHVSLENIMKNNNITLNEKKSMSMKSKKAIMGSIFIAPALIFIFIFLLLPAILAFIYSFQNYNMLKPHAKVFVALQNYMEILKDPAFYKVLKNTVYFAAIVVPAQSAVALLLALIVNAKQFYIHLGLYCLHIMPEMIYQVHLE